MAAWCSEGDVAGAVDQLAAEAVQTAPATLAPTSAERGGMERKREQ